jgi:hypothetical protein
MVVFSWLNKFILLIAGTTAVLASFILIAWAFQFQSVFGIDRLFAEYNPWGIFGVFLILVFGSAYFLKGGVTIIKGIIKE